MCAKIAPTTKFYNWRTNDTDTWTSSEILEFKNWIFGNDSIRTKMNMSRIITEQLT